MRLRLAALAAVAAVAAGCGSDNNGPVIPQTHYNIALEATPATVQLAEDDSVIFNVDARDVDTKLVLPYPGIELKWDKKNVAFSVDTLGQTWLHAIGPASSTVTASMQNVNKDSTLTLDIPVTVTPVPAGSIAVDSVQTQDDTAFAAITGALALYSDSVNGGQSLQLHATVLDPSSQPMIVRVRHWTASGNVADTVIKGTDTTLVPIVKLTDADSAITKVTALRPGTVWMVASVDGANNATLSDSVQLTVTSLPVDSVEVKIPATAPDTFSVGATVQLTATPLSASGKKLTDREVTWTSDNQAVAVVSSSGLVTMTGAGTANITATAEGKSGTVAIIVQ